VFDLLSHSYIDEFRGARVATAAAVIALDFGRA
jgi:hypothetical protein